VVSGPADVPHEVDVNFHPISPMLATLGQPPGNFADFAVEDCGDDG